MFSISLYVYIQNIKLKWCMRNETYCAIIWMSEKDMHGDEWVSEKEREGGRGRERDKAKGSKM